MPAKIIQRNKKPMKKVKVDSVTIDIIESALRNARYEMDTVLFRTAMAYYLAGDSQRAYERLDLERALILFGPVVLTLIWAPS